MTTKAKSQLAAVAEQVDRIHDILTTRLPNQRSNVAAEIAATKWLCVARQDNAAALLKKCKLQVSNYRFRVLEQGERLTRLLCDLDLVESDGDKEIRQERKQLVLRIQDELVIADAAKLQCDKLVAFHDRMFPTPAADSTPASPVAPTNVESTADEAHDPVNDTDKVDMDTNEQSDAEEGDDDGDDDGDDQGDDDMDNNDPDDQDEESHIPVWQPRFELREGRDGAAYLVADLTGVDLNRHLDVQVDGEVLRLSGTKLPTPRDLQLMRMTGQPTFGRFAIEETFPSHLFNLQNATLRRVSHGVVEVRIPRAAARVNPFFPRSYAASQRRASPFANMGMAW